MCGHQVRSYGPLVTTNDLDPRPRSGSTADADTHPPHYEIRVRGRLDARWAAWFDGMHVVAGPDGTTTIRGAVVDQAALHGLLVKVRDLGIPLLALRQISPDAPAAAPAPHPDQGA
jgi:hypothetical protein